MNNLVAVALVLLLWSQFVPESGHSMLTVRAAGPTDPVVVKDRKRLTDAIKAASRCGQPGHISEADFDGCVADWKADIYILPLDIENAIRKHNTANPDDPLVAADLEVHAVNKNLLLCNRGIHEFIQELLREHLSELTGQKLDEANFGRILVKHWRGLAVGDRAAFIANLTNAQAAVRTAAKKTFLALASDENHCEKVFVTIGDLTRPAMGTADRVAKAKKEFKDEFEKAIKAAAKPSEK